MAKQKTLKKDYEVNPSGEIVITETVERTLSKKELQNEKVGYLNRQMQIDSQIEDLKSQKLAIGKAVTELDDMIASIEVEEEA